MSSGKKIPEAMRNRIKEMSETGMTNKEIASEIGISTCTVSRICRGYRRNDTGTKMDDTWSREWDKVTQKLKGEYNGTPD